MTLKTLIRWEQLRAKPYAAFDPADPAAFEALLYVRALDSGAARGHTLDTYRRVLQKAPQLYERQADDLRREMQTIQQFIPAGEKPHGTPAPPADSPEPLSATAAFLVAEGMDAHYVMEELQMPDIPTFLNAYRHRRQEQMEASRLWTWLAILPHTGTRRFPNGPADLLRFPWENARPAARPITTRETDALEAFLASGRRWKKQTTKTH